MSKETANCIVCYKPATVWIGHVVKSNRDKLIAGWCEACLRKFSRNPGFFGSWRKRMGEENDEWK